MKRYLLVAWMGACGLIAVGAAAQPAGLGGTTWVGDGSCGVIYFFADGTAVVTESDASTTAQWTLDGDKLHLDYDNWYGGIAGGFRDGDRLEATKTWMPDNAKAAIYDHCVFHKKAGS